MSHYRPYPKERAQRRLNGEDVFGRKINVSSSSNWRDYSSPRKFGRKSTKSVDNVNGSRLADSSYLNNTTQSRELSWRSAADRDHNLMLQESNMFRATWSTQSSQEWRICGRPRTPQDELHSDSFQYASNTSLVELVISNLDASIKDLRNSLLNLLKEHVAVYNLSICNQADGSPVALLKVGSQQDAQNVISQVHHQKLGFKRLSIAYAQTNTLDHSTLKEIVIGLLQDAPLNSMPLYRLLNLLKERCFLNVSVSEVNKLRDICRITDENGERIISLTSEIRSSTPNLQKALTLYCSIHCPNGITEDLGWGSADDTEMVEIPHIKISLKLFTTKLNILLTSHMGVLPLLSFAICYKREFNQYLPTDPTGVPLEHLITCINDVKLRYGGTNKNTKYIVREISIKQDSEREEECMKSLSPSITANMSLLCRELVDLLKTTDSCQIQLSKYIPAYHHHFGRQLRVADYGYTKLSELLYSTPISNVVQILGEGGNRVITLTHKTQMRRFTSDLLRILKNQVAKQIYASEFSQAYERVINKPFNACEYGLCSLDDLLDEVPENIVVISNHEDKLISIPKREQTAIEIVRTKQFAEEVVKLLSYSPQCSMLFNKFVPAYHHHFGHQCKVSDYGFTKLIELFESIPDTVKVEELSNGERKVSLTLPEAIHLLGCQLSDLIKKSHLSCLPVEAILSLFQREYGYPLKPQYYECKDVCELMDKLSNHVQITYSNAGPLLVIVESDVQSTLALRVWALLINPPHYLNLATLINLYNMRYQNNVNVVMLEQLNNVIVNKSSNMESIIFLTPQYATAAKLYLLLYREGGQVPYSSLESMYRRHYGVPLTQGEEGSHEKLFSEFSFLFIVRRTRRKTNIALNPKITEYGLSLPNFVGITNNSSHQIDDLVSWPPPPIHEVSNRGITPPKPDTPPAAGSAEWKMWETPLKCNSNMDFSIPLPAVNISDYVESNKLLISPTKSLLSPNCSSLMMIAPPDPTELPMPDKLLKKGVISDDSADSGVNNSHFISENEMDMSTENTGTKPKFALPELMYKF